MQAVYLKADNDLTSLVHDVSKPDVSLVW